MNDIRTGSIVYTERAFEQDADLAMGSDIVRALVELITNADDAYGSRIGGDIRVEVALASGAPPTVTVRDRAKGLTRDGLEECFGVLGGQTSGFAEGQRVRGLLGRGAKDTAAFGRTIFETIKDDVYGRFELHRSGAWTSEDRPATADDRARLGIPTGENGLSASMVVERAGISMPTRAMLTERLTRHVQLRDVTNRRAMTLRVSTDGAQAPTNALQWDQPVGEVLFDDNVLVPSYGVDAALRLIKLPTPSPDRLDAYSTHGVVIRGGFVSFANTLFGETGPETAWIHGSIACEHIDRLIREFDEHGGSDALNPSRLLRRDRDGLAQDHPFTSALATAVLDVLAPILADLRPTRAAAGGGDELREDLDRASRSLAALLRADLQRLEAEEPTGGTQPNNANPILVIPPRVAMRVGSERTLTVLIDDTSVPADAVLTAVTDDPATITLISTTERIPHALFSDTSVFNVRVLAVGLGHAAVSIGAADNPATASTQIRVHDDPVEPTPPPTTLEWASPSMSVTAGKERSVRLRAPIELAPNGSLDCSLSIDGAGVRLIDDSVTLTLCSDGWLQGRVRVHGEVVDASAVLEALAAGQNAVGHVRVTRPTTIGGSNLDVEVLDEGQGHLRGALRETDTGHVVQIFGRHAALEPVLGSRLEDGSFEKESQPTARIALSEAIAATIADWLVRTDGARQPHLYTDADSVLSERSKVLTRYLVPLVRVLTQGTS